MFALVRLIFRRITNKRVQKSAWLRRLLLIVAIARWVMRFLDKPQVIRLRKNETATVSVRQRGDN